MQTTSTELRLRADTAREIMSPNVLSVSKTTSVRAAAQFLIDLSISAAPVIDEAGRPVGVISRSDIVRQIARLPNTNLIPPYYCHVTLKSDGVVESLHVTGSEQEQLVSEIMMAVVMSVPEEAPVARVIALMLTENIHRVFVTDKKGALVGVISAFDILSRLGV
jgi:CBS domain-containing protein